ncbi:MAG: aminotransferase class III-fold pyridoxal phosphate-dependent enzyme [Ardenticatenales bacterium]|nr:aminotransferase class III-fold pyridoxal phosphate-dependent enzyme [Ardenticatenales bacterium]
MSETTRPDTLTFATRGLPMIDHGDGVYLYDDQGNQYLDGSGGPAVYCLGHRHPEVTAAIMRSSWTGSPTPIVITSIVNLSLNCKRCWPDWLVGRSTRWCCRAAARRR